MPGERERAGDCPEQAVCSDIIEIMQITSTVLCLASILVKHINILIAN